MKKDNYDLIEWKNTGIAKKNKNEEEEPFPIKWLKWTNEGHKMKLNKKYKRTSTNPPLYLECLDKWILFQIPLK